VAGVDLRNAHSARYDARAAAGLLGVYLAGAGQPPPWSGTVARSAAAAWPPLPGDAEPPVERTSPDEPPPPHFLSRLVDRLPRLHRPDADAYLEVLDRALVARQLSATYADALVATADRLGLSRADVRDLHVGYLRALAEAAGNDLSGDLSEGDRRDLDTVAALLGLPPSNVDSALAGPAASPAARRFRLAPGDTVVFTGMTAEPREVWEERARAAGLRVGATVTRATRLLVAADPDTMSGKADRAHRYGIPVVHPAAFTALVDAME
jgi:DNA polymerase-3 subunit epsilon